MTSNFDFGMIGLGVMGRNFILNVADHGYAAIGLDLDTEKVKALETEGSGKAVKGVTDTAQFVAFLKKPRCIMLLVPAGKAVDSVIESLLPLMDAGDLIIDGGNSHFDDTIRRQAYLAEKQLHFLGTGVSGGSEGARRGPSIMPGGKLEAYQLVQPILEAVAAKVNDEPCVAYMGEGAAGHYVKMVHNGIEYGLMQLIAETYDVLKQVGGLSNEELHEVFAQWNQGALQSFLIEITAAIFQKKDDLSSAYLVDQLLDKAKQKGTGKWTSQNAMDLGIPIPTIDAAVTMRGISALKADRVQASKHFDPMENTSARIAKSVLIDLAGDALHFAFITTYAQGLHLLAEAAAAYHFGLNLETIARIWRGGCIIRAALLEKIRQAYSSESDIKHLFLSPVFRDSLAQGQVSSSMFLGLASEYRLPAMAHAASLHYFNAFTSSRLPLNLVQAQRDYFGAHTYERVDREGIFHTDDWD
ncbi:MAG TPA: NADP-dependent phosphogluconate dehydrogenase [Saprospiraceae bacterium]|nr:NADP-dependent phosphogluconate dehydrogenase [Saprospiraceae bacterium]HMQ83967.1 NADP-dependent phosphogluconate dehydrogenase [Saprospiraceae bacterium]